MIKMRAILCFIWEMQMWTLGTPYFFHAIRLCHFDICCMKYSWKLINSPKISFSLFLYWEKCAFENGRKWPSPSRHREEVANLKSSYFQKKKRYWAKLFSVKVNHAIQHYNMFWTNLKRVELGHYENSGRLASNDRKITVALKSYVIIEWVLFGKDSAWPTVSGK